MEFHVTLHCTPAVKHYVLRFAHKAETDGPVRINSKHHIGKTLLRVLGGKTVEGNNRQPSAYSHQLTVVIPEHYWNRGCTTMTGIAEYEFNNYVMSILREQMYMFIIGNLKTDPEYHIRKGIQQWLELMEFPEDSFTMDALVRYVYDERKRSDPEQLRSLGRPSKKSCNKTHLKQAS